MKWSQLKKETESRFAACVQGKIHLYSTRYRRPDSNRGRGWITYKKEQIVNFETILSWVNYGAYYHEDSKTPCLTHKAIDVKDRTPGRLIERGEFSRFDLHEACWELLNLSINDALKSRNPIIQGLAFLDRRIGMQRIVGFSTGKLHPFAKKMLKIRLYEETAK